MLSGENPLKNVVTPIPAFKKALISLGAKRRPLQAPVGLPASLPDQVPHTKKHGAMTPKRGGQARRVFAHQQGMAR